MNEWLGRVDPGRKAQQARTRAALVGLVQRAGQDLLLDAGRVPGGRFPAAGHVHGMEFLVFLVDAHFRPSSCSGPLVGRTAASAGIQYWSLQCRYNSVSLS